MASSRFSSPHVSSYARLLTVAHGTLMHYGQCLNLLEARCLKPLLSCLGSVAIACTLLSSAAIAAEPMILSFDLDAEILGAGGQKDASPGPTPGSLIVSSAAGQTQTVASADLSQVHGGQAQGWQADLANLDRADDSWLDEIVDQGIAPKTVVAHPKIELKDSTLSLKLLEPGLVASAPLALSHSVRRLGQAITSNPGATKTDLSADLSGEPSKTPEKKSDRQTVAQANAEMIPEEWWHQGEKSPIAVAIGAAEGTRYANGGKTSAYYWHTDPGNGADNFGTFSYQHLPSSLTQAVRNQATTAGKREVAAQNQLPEISDRSQMKRLRRFHDQLMQQAAEQGLVMGRLEILNALDLANQSEAAALWQQGYIDRLAQMQEFDDDIEEQILQARSWSYWNPDRKTWDAPGLGNNYENVRRDQLRRMEAIKQALREYGPAAESLQNERQNISMGADSIGADSMGADRSEHEPEGRPGNPINSGHSTTTASTMSMQRPQTMSDDAIASQIIAFDLRSL